MRTFGEAHWARPMADHNEKPLLRKVVSEKHVKRLDPRRANPSKGILAVGQARPVELELVNCSRIRSESVEMECGQPSLTNPPMI